MKSILIGLVLAFSLPTLAQVEEFDFQVTTPRGDKVDVSMFYEHSDEIKPAVVLAPGGRYHKDLPLLKQSAQKIAELGYVVATFNWHYFSSNTGRSEGAVEEQEDMQTVLNLLKRMSSVDSNKILIGGKSYGSIVSYRVFAANPDVKGLLLLTPICTNSWDENGELLPEPEPVGDHYYPTLKSDARPSMLVFGNRDGYCTLPEAYDFLKDSNGQVALNILEGDHGLSVGDEENPAYADRNAANISTATDIVRQWAKLIIDAL